MNPKINDITMIGRTGEREAILNTARGYVSAKETAAHGLAKACRTAQYIALYLNMPLPLVEYWIEPHSRAFQYTRCKRSKVQLVWEMGYSVTFCAIAFHETEQQIKNWCGLYDTRLITETNPLRG